MEKKLIEYANEARLKSYAPYSGFNVGAALLSKDGKIFTGTNIECASYSMTCCAERTAFFKAVSEGVTEFSMIAIVGANKSEVPDKPCFPCGACLQVMNEFCDKNFIILTKNGSEIKSYRLDELSPLSFSL